jgi:hypothetical protein
MNTATPNKFKFEPEDPDKQLADILAFTKAWHQASIRTEYDVLCDRVVSAQAAYIHKLNNTPTQVFLGQREYNALRLKPPYMEKSQPTLYQPEPLFEMEVILVLKDEFLKVA